MDVAYRLHRRHWLDRELRPPRHAWGRLPPILQPKSAWRREALCGQVGCALQRHQVHSGRGRGAGSPAAAAGVAAHLRGSEMQ